MKRQPRLATISLACAIAGCSAPYMPDAGVVPDATADSSVGPCEGEYLVFDFQLDGVAGSTGCVRARIGTAISPGVLAHEVAYAVEVPREDWGLPPGICAATTVFYNTPMESGAMGVFEHVEAIPPADPWVARVVTQISYAVSPEGEAECSPVPVPSGWETGHLTLTGGTWAVVQGGTEPGDWIEVDARDVTFEPFAGHTFRFDRMRWGVRLQEPVVLP